jgi:hypothetical protein
VQKANQEAKNHCIKKNSKDMLNLIPVLNQSMANLQLWRNRYEKQEYPEKVIKNIFYRKHIIDSIFPSFLRCFNNGKQWNSFDEGMDIIKKKYEEASKSIVLVLDTLILTKGNINVGDCSFNSFINDINLAKQGNNAKVEELEYANVYYNIADESVLCWTVYGGMGYSQRDAIGELTGQVLLEDKPITLFWQIESVLGRLGGLTLQNYRQLPPLF